MELLERLDILTGIAQRHPEIGKTAMMKCTYFLQEIEKVPLNYNFKIYTYGPYSSEVMEELDYARQSGLLDIKWSGFPNGLHFYSISALDKGTTQYDKQIDSIMDVFGEKTAKELELLSTILFVQRANESNKLKKDKTTICESVEKIKPRFTEKEVETGYNFMKCHNYL